VIDYGGRLRIDCDYSTDLFDDATIARWIGHFRNLLLAIVEDAERPVTALPLMDPAELDRLVTGLNHTAVAFDTDLGVHTLVAAQARRTPDSIAATFEDDRITYAALDRRANQLAHHLRALLPTGEQRVGILLDRSIDMLVALLGVMKAGYAYVPLDPRHPTARLRLVLSEARVAALIADSAAAEALLPADASLVHLVEHRLSIAERPDHAPDIAVQGNDIAYIIFTSGSTGSPKGVEVRHRAVANLLLSIVREPGLASNDVLVAVTTIAFDIAALELFGPLVAGGQVVITASAELADGIALLERLRHSEATIVQATPSLWRILFEAGFKSRPGLRMLCGGEPLTRELADQLLDGGGELWNMYGPTETTIWSFTDRVTPDTQAVTIGHPIANTRFYILDRHDQLVPLGVTGELNIAGDGLARGYVGQPEVTRAAFREIRLADGPCQRVYRTGDLARYLADGRVQILGRRDNQVKLRGFRIELGEIEAALTRTPGIVAAAVALQPEAEHGGRLVGYYVAGAGSAVTARELERSLTQSLPDYMIPTAWFQLDAMPLTPNGKLDRAALPWSETAAIPREVVAPRSPLESRLASIWAEVLRCDAISVHDNIFSLGADSIQIFQISARMNHAGIELSARHLMQHPTIAQLSEAWEAVQRAGAVRSSFGPSLDQFKRASGGSGGTTAPPEPMQAEPSFNPN
jgi:amino acid adenylation domain-containing protein